MKKDRANANSNATPPRVLIVDDDSDLRRLIREILQEEDILANEAENGREAQEMLQCGSYDLMITDLVMPEQEGIETIRAVRKERSNFRILAISGANPHWLKLARMLGADATVRKPFTPDELLQAAKSLLATR